MKLFDYLNSEALEKLILEGYINVRHHPTLPLRILNYGPEAQFTQHWPHEVCASRGLIVDDEDKIVARPQYKFFNLGQASTVYGSIFDAHEVFENVMIDEAFIAALVRESKKPLTLTRKMDGQMGVLWNYKGQWGISTRGSFESDGAKFGTEKFQKFVKFGATEFIPEGWTLIFEIIAKHLRIVVPYAWEGLCLLTAVNIETGEEMPYEKLHELWVNLNSYSKTNDAEGNPTVPGKPWCRLVEKFDIDIETAKNDPSMEEEGYVVAVNRPLMPPIKVKIKLAEYCRLHKVLTGLTPQMIWKELAYPTSPWLETVNKFDHKTGEQTHSMNVPKEFSAWVKQWQKGMTKAFHEIIVSAIHWVEYLRQQEGFVSPEADLETWKAPFKNDKERKVWLIKVPGVTPEVANVVILLYHDKLVEAYETVWEMVRPFGRDDKFFQEGKGE